ncbi:hypothetical protein CC86DRAFT_366701 [Ophiobolus disseminans]|uniref:CoA-dependent acyltransferase n=1 Tax=Ophiobolus disseminans TaxID=1469910 RepID=A0A6A7ADD0_9PLEO|nr:hypothetical protein CC86DRAFT_366701 [Ophiobolus disseminans]
MASPQDGHWLDNYSNNKHPWQQSTSHNGHQAFKRPLGLVETSFDTDGTYFGGRADMTATLKLCTKYTLSKPALKRKVALSWTLLRLYHSLLSARVEVDQSNAKRSFAIDIPHSPAAALQEVEKSITWLEDHDLDTSIDDIDLHHHALNVSRIIRPEECLSKLHVLPLKPLADGTCELTFLIVIAHQISDGLSAYNWFSEFIRILNTRESGIDEQIKTALSPAYIKKRLPPAQEDLYPKVPGSIARQRWFWAITRVLRHVQVPMRPTFTNPLFRDKRLGKAIPLPQTYAGVFDYSEETRPPMSSGHVTATLSAAASARLVALCRGAKISIGAGCFALAGLAMMRIHEQRNPGSTEHAFGASFPLNPRAFFSPMPEADSCMLAFSEGILMPFLPSSLPVDKRFLLVAKHANRELRVYQKRLKDGGQGIGSFDKHSPARLLATGYLAQIERVDAKLPEERRTGYTPQGQLKPRVGMYGATCGVSSVGSLAAYFKSGANDLENVEQKDFVADYRSLKMGVRARENEFLIGSSSDADGIIAFGVSYDENAISQEAAENWAKAISGLLEEESLSKL